MVRRWLHGSIQKLLGNDPVQLRDPQIGKRVLKTRNLACGHIRDRCEEIVEVLGQLCQAISYGGFAPLKISGWRDAKLDGRPFVLCRQSVESDDEGEELQRVVAGVLGRVIPVLVVSEV